MERQKLDKTQRKKRIDYVCRSIAKIWKTMPDLRFGQIMSIMFGITPKDTGVGASGYQYESKLDPFYWEDTDFLNKLREKFNYGSK